MGTRNTFSVFSFLLFGLYIFYSKLFGYKKKDHSIHTQIWVCFLSGIPFPSSQTTSADFLPALPRTQRFGWHWDGSLTILEYGRGGDQLTQKALS